MDWGRERERKRRMRERVMILCLELIWSEFRLNLRVIDSEAFINYLLKRYRGFRLSVFKSYLHLFFLLFSNMCE
jgi:hypothetical protein